MFSRLDKDDEYDGRKLPAWLTKKSRASF